MTDLERLWDDYPAGKPPVREILAAADAGLAAAHPPHRRFVVRPLLTAAAATVLVGAFVGGTLVGGSDDVTPPGIEHLPGPVAFQADLPAAESCDQLLASYVDRGLELVSAWGWGGPPHPYYYEGAENGPVTKDLSDGVPLSADTGSAANRRANPQTDRQVNSETGTNVQETGVDEPDSVKTDGKVLAVVRDDELTVYDVTGRSSRKTAELELPGVEGAELVLSGDTLVAVGGDDSAGGDEPGDGIGTASTRVLRIDIADPAAPEIVDDIHYDAAVLSTRQHGTTVRLVLSSGLPALDFVEPGAKRTEKEALARNRKAVRESKIEDWLPTVTVGDKGQRLLDCTSVAIPSDELALDTVSVVGFDAAAPTRVEAIGLAGRTEIAYESPDHLYLVARSSDGSCLEWCEPLDEAPGRLVDGGPAGSSYLFDFALDGTSATHVASGEVEGSIRDRWSIDEAEGVVRVAVGPTSETGNFNSVVTLERQGRELVERGRLDDLGPREDIKSVRWFDDLAIMVTFRQVDPLYAVDLTDTARPRLLGKLKIPGFSSYLHPLGSWRMVGVGEGPDGRGGWGAQVGLFDVRDVTKVRRLDVHSYGRSFRALAGRDPRAFTWLPDHRTVLTVLERRIDRRVGFVSVLRLQDGRLHERLVRVEYGDDVDHVRAVPMPDGRVVLVTGEKADFFPLEG